MGGSAGSSQEEDSFWWHRGVENAEKGNEVLLDENGCACNETI